MVNYFLYDAEVMKHSEAVDKGEVVQLSIMDQVEKMWSKAKVMLYSKPIEGGEPIALLAPYGTPHEEGKYYVKIVEILPPEELEEESY